MTSDMEVQTKQSCGMEFLHVEKNGPHQHSLTLAERLWKPNSGCEHSEVAGGAFQQWQQQQWLTSTGVDVYKHGVQALVHCW